MDIAVLAHQGGWDEIAVLVVPVVLIIAVVLIGQLQQRKRLEDRPDDD